MSCINKLSVLTFDYHLFTFPIPTVESLFDILEVPKLVNLNFVFQESWGPRKFLCEFCSSAHTHSGSYYKHMMSKHLDAISKIWIKCKICDTYLPNQVLQISDPHSVQQFPLIRTVRLLNVPLSKRL